MELVYKPKRILITGARGRVASALDHFLDLSGAIKKLYSRVGSQIYNPLTDLLTGKEIRRGDVILHFAWSTLPLSAELLRSEEKSVDIILLEDLLKAILASGAITGVHFIFISTGAVYGEATDTSSNEKCRPTPKGRYACEKLFAENIIREFSEKTGLAYTILRVSNLYGFSSPSIRQQGIVPKLIANGINSQKITVWGNGDARKDYLHIHDFTSALKQIITKKLVGTFNISYGNSFKLSDLICKVEDLLSKKIIIDYCPAMPWDILDNRIDNQMFCDQAEWMPLVTLDEGLIQTFGLLNELEQQVL